MGRPAPVASTSRVTLDSIDLSIDNVAPCTCFRRRSRHVESAKTTWWRAATTAAVCVLTATTPTKASARAVPTAAQAQVHLDWLDGPLGATAAATGPAYALKDPDRARPQRRRRRRDNDAGLVTPPTPTPRKRRDVLDKYEYISGEWVINHEWTLLGRTGHAPTATPRTIPESADDEDDMAMGEANVEPTRTLTTSTRLSSAATRTLSPSSSLVTPKPSVNTDFEKHASPKIAAAATSSSFSIPDGWAATPRETGFYAVPIIVAMSVLVAVMVIGTVFGSVLWRRHERNKRKRRRARRKAQQAGLVDGTLVDEKEVGDGSGGAGDSAGRVAKFVNAVGIRRKKRHARKSSDAVVSAADGTEATLAEATATALERTATRGSTSSGRRTAGQVRAAIVAGSARIRRRRRNRLGMRTSDHPGSDSSDDDADSMTEALTQSDSARRPDTLTSRLHSRLSAPLGRTNSSSSERVSPTVYSRDLDRTVTQSTADSADRLSRTSSRTSHLTLDSISRVVGLGQPADDGNVLPLHRPVTPTAPGSTFGSTVPDAQLPALGPPAYRPSSSTLQTPSRFSVSRVPVPRVAVTDTDADARGNANEEEWHWPGEKGRNVATSSSAVASSSSNAMLPLPHIESASVEDEDDEPPEDRALFSAHLATDDKSVLARIRQQAEVVSAASTSSARRDDNNEDDDIGPPSVLGLASAPPAELDPFLDADGLDVDEDGFERFPGASSSVSARIQIPEPSAPPSLVDADSDAQQRTTSTFLLPAPPRPVNQSVDYMTRSSAPSLSSSSLSPLASSSNRILHRTSALPLHVEENDLRQVEERGVLPEYEPNRRQQITQAEDMV
ncbi:hypothetical protein OIV83_004380 [Microbotryomycetes sp. JL201]|nr:hypothetical protein OIV83_004380 [Microbotryomycetes sp. JL201]